MYTNIHGTDMIDAWSIGLNLYAYIRLNFERGSTILQLGSGKMDELLLLDYDLISIEHDENWLKPNCIHCPIVNGYYNLPDTLPDYDLLLIDGPPSKIGRGGITNHIKKFNLSRTIIMDDTNRTIEANLAEWIGKQAGRKPIYHQDQNNKQFGVI